MCSPDFAHIGFLTLPLLWFLHWNRFPKAGWLCGLFLLAGQLTHPRAPNGDSVAILQCRWVQLLWLFTICKGTGGQGSKEKTLRRQGRGEVAELTQPPWSHINFFLASETAGLQPPSAQDSTATQPAGAESP